MIENTLLLAVATLVAVRLFLPRVRDSRDWRATVTPLASIIGSGFLVAAPLLYHAVNGWSVLAMAGIVVLAYSIGGVVRYNIRHAEPLLESGSSSDRLALTVTELLSSLVLSIAYVISVAFYLRLLASFVLRALEIESELLANVITTGILVFIAVNGAWRGLSGLERLEESAVNVKLSIIAALLVGLAWFDLSGWLEGSIDVVFHPVTDWPDTLRNLAGVLLIVQGFETSRYLGAEYDAQTRIRTMRYAQLLSGVVYLLFIALITPLVSDFHESHDETVIIAISAMVALVLPAMLTVAAAMSQFSAAVADTVGSGGLLADISHHRLTPSRGYILVSLAAIALVWSASIFEIISIASRAFAAYYLLQCVVALLAARGRGHYWQQAGFIGVGVVLLWVVIFAIPAEG